MVSIFYGTEELNVNTLFFMILTTEQTTQVDDIIADAENKLSALFGTITTVSYKTHRRIVYKSEKYAVIFKAIHEVTGYDEEVLGGNSRVSPLPDLRHIFMALCRDFTVMILKDIGAKVNRGHCDVIHAVNKVDILLQTSKEFNTLYTTISNRVIELISESKKATV